MTGWCFICDFYHMLAVKLAVFFYIKIVSDWNSHENKSNCEYVFQKKKTNYIA